MGRLCFLIILLTSCDGVGIKGPQPSIPLENIWSRQHSQIQPTRPIIENGLVFFATQDRIHSFDLETGAEKWSTDVRFFDTLNLISEGTTLFLVSGNAVLALNKNDGSIIWENIGGGGGRSIVADHNSSYLGMGGARNEINIYAKADGSLRKFLTPDTGELQLPQLLGDVAMADDMICTSTKYLSPNEKPQPPSANAFCLDLEMGSVIWQRYYPPEFYDTSESDSTFRFIEGQGAEIWNDTVIMSVGPYLDSYNRYTGERIWRRFLDGQGNPLVDSQHGDELDVAPEIVGDTLYVGTGLGTIQSLDPRDGSMHWKIETKYWFFDLFDKSNDRLVFKNGGLHVVDTNTGEILFYLEYPEDSPCFLGTPAIHGDIIVAPACSSIHAYRIPKETS